MLVLECILCELFGSQNVLLVKTQNIFDVIWNVILKLDYPIDFLKTYFHCWYVN